MEFMDQINAMMIDMFGPLGPVFLIGGLGILMILLVLPSLAFRNADPFDRLKPKETNDHYESSEALRHKSGNKNLERYSSFLEPQNEEEMSAVRLKLRQAGYKSKDAVMIYHLAQMVLGLGLLAGGVLYMLATKGDTQPTMTNMIMKILGPGIAGYMFPKYWVTRRQAARNEEIGYGFPDSLDMMLVCVEAGQSLDQAIVRVSRELQSGFPVLAEEYDIVSLELKAGKDKTQVLRDFAERTENDDITSFVSVLIQSQAYGTSIGEALRVYSAEMRDKRVMRAEERANKLPTKLTLTTMMLTVPPLLIILMSPSVVSMSKAFGGV